ncbi:MAG: radical SAM protein [Bacteroidales bacterium]|nr:radical SAM protein [Bacteroidales bacterium]
MFSNYICELTNFFTNKTYSNKLKLWSHEYLHRLLNLTIDQHNTNIVEIAELARSLTFKYFGKQILLYTPLYISNYCRNTCLYCGYSAINKFRRIKLTLPEIEKEFKQIKNKGINNILILTGDDKVKTPITYIANVVTLAGNYFSQVNLEIYSLNEKEYNFLSKKGVYGITLYQETYDKNLYDVFHKKGDKCNYLERLNAIEYAINGGIKEVTIGPLLGLNKNWQYELFMTICHAYYLIKKYPWIEINVSFPRICNSIIYSNIYHVADKDFIKIILLTRILLPYIGINLSTREPPLIRDNLIGYGITKISAESKTSVGGYNKTFSKHLQFETKDTRSVEEIILSIKNKGLRPEFINNLQITHK